MSFAELPDGAAPKLRGVTLTLTERCNLRCSYCHARRSAQTMSAATADRAVDLLSGHSGSHERLWISFYGGEPLLQRQLIERVLSRARLQARTTQRVECTLPTNGLLLTPEFLELCKLTGIDLALSIDGTTGSSERCFANGGDARDTLVSRLATLSASARRPMVRMTVTPSNVGSLAENVKALTRLGARRIVYQPALELDWDEARIAIWQRENERIATFLLGRAALGGAAVEIPTLAAIRSRLTSGAPRRACGAGVEHVAVSTDGRVFPCYRFVFEQSRDLELGTVREGLHNARALRRLRVLGPADLQPEQGSCKQCPASDGCTHFCPATGYLLAGDLRKVPRVVCALMRAQVAAVRETLARDTERRSPGPRRALPTALFLAASAMSLAACGGKLDAQSGVRIDSGPDAGGAPTIGAEGGSTGRSSAGNGAGGATASGGTGGWYGGGMCTGGMPAYDAGAGGVCAGAAPYDAGLGGVCGGASGWDAGGGGVCPARVGEDAGSDSGSGGTGGFNRGGLCH